MAEANPGCMSNIQALNEKETQKLYRALLRNCKPVSTREELALIRKAFTLAKSESDKLPLSFGQPEIAHSLAIAVIVAQELSLVNTSIIASLISNYIGEGQIDLSFVKKEFGKKVAEISDGLLNISGIKMDKNSSQAENLRNLILTLAKDVRVILIKIAERMYVMRNIDQYSEDERIRIASETKYIFSPLAHRLGLYNMMSEMEDIIMRILEPMAYFDIQKQLQATKAKRNKFIKEFIEPIESELSNQKLLAEVKGRPKAISSIWKKMKKQKVEFSEVYDKFAIRIILNSKPSKEKSDCWRTYSVVTDIYKPNPNRLRDWISVPKSNGYESLHTTVVVPGGEWVEVQIRSERMNEIAEKGFAAHWKYKGIKGEAGIDEWLAKVRSVLENPETDALNLIDDFQLSLENKEIFVFTPQGDLKKFSEGATVLDFAFDIHTNVGLSCAGAKVNGKNVPIRYQLSNGDKVEIIRSKNQKAKLDWLNYVVSSKAKTKIKQVLKEAKLKEAENGKDILRRRLKNWKFEFNDPNVRKIIHHYKYKDAIDLYYDISTEKLDLLQIKEVLVADLVKPEPAKPHPMEEASVEKIVRSAMAEAEDFLVIDDKLSGVDYRLGKCCNPIFGDEIFGFVTISTGITIHRINCPNAHDLISRYGYRVVKARWSKSEKDHQFLATLRISGVDDLGIVSNISEVISKDLKVNMRSFNMDTSDGLFEGTVNVFIQDTDHLGVLQRKLAKVKGVSSVRRID
jgi:guanosine-3',5'-bis(diphosphate) 3'-pyrophosphohydrolase